MEPLLPGCHVPILDCSEIMRTDDFTVRHVTLKAAWLGKKHDHQGYPGSNMNPKTALEGCDLVTEPEPGVLTRRTPVGTIGSCFATNIKRWLVEHGYQFVQAEVGPAALEGSCRFGTVYNAACLRQIFEMAYGIFTPEERYWPVDDVIYDPYRRKIGWPDRRSADAEREAHFDAVRRMVRTCEVLICTVGLSEVWRSTVERATFHTKPPPPNFDPERHEFAVASVEETRDDLVAMYDLLTRENPNLRLVVSVSPVPLRMTYRDMHVVTADTVSKAVVRAGVDELCRARPDVLYFPSYEIVKRTTPSPFVDDNVHVRREVVGEIMKRFTASYGDPSAGLDRLEPKSAPTEPHAA